MKKRQKIILSVLLLSLIFFVIICFIVKKNNSKASTIENIQINENSIIKDDEAYGEEYVTSLSMIIKSMVNNKNADLSYLEDVVNKESSAYNGIKDKIVNYRNKNITIEYLDYYIEKVEKIDTNEYKISIKSDESINEENKNQKLQKSIEIRLRLQDDKGIYEYKEK